MKNAAIAALLLAFCASAYAHDERRSPPASILGGVVQERDVGLVFDYLREALDAAIEGRETPPAAAIEERANEIGKEMKRRGATAARVIIDAIEKSVRDGLREPAPRPAPTPSTVYRRI